MRASFKNNNNNQQPFELKAEETSPLCGLTLGVAGTGKSHVIHAIMHEIRSIAGNITTHMQITSSKL